MKHLGFSRAPFGREPILLMKKRESGFSVLELVIVVAITLIVAAMAAPSVNRVVNNYRLYASGRGVVTVLQQARMAAVQANQPYYVWFNGCGAPNITCAVPAGRLVPLAVLPGDPHAVTASNVSFPAAGPPNTATLDAFVGGAPQVGAVIGFNARGLPCLQGVSPWVCTPGAGVGYEWFIQSSATQAWAAITVTPAGRIRSWRMTAPGVWQ
jgi:type II secretory pathway pseudopilin PulG